MTVLWQQSRQVVFSGGNTMTKTGKWIVAILIIMVAIPLIGIFLILINYSFATNPAQLDNEMCHLFVSDLKKAYPIENARVTSPLSNVVYIDVDLEDAVTKDLKENRQILQDIIQYFSQMEVVNSLKDTFYHKSEASSSQKGQVHFDEEGRPILTYQVALSGGSSQLPYYRLTAGDGYQDYFDFWRIEDVVSGKEYALCIGNRIFHTSLSQQMQDLMPQYCPSSDGLVTATQLSAAGQVSLTVFLPKAQGYDEIHTLFDEMGTLMLMPEAVRAYDQVSGRTSSQATDYTYTLTFCVPAQTTGLYEVLYSFAPQVKQDGDADLSVWEVRDYQQDNVSTETLLLHPV